MNQRTLESLATFPALLAILVARLERDGVLEPGAYAIDLRNALQSPPPEGMSEGAREALTHMLELVAR